MLQSISQMFSGNANNQADTDRSDSDPFNSALGIDMNTLLKMKMIMDKMKPNKSDPRSQLLLSLKPYLKETRKSKVDQYIQLFNMSKVLEVFNPGGEKSK